MSHDRLALVVRLRQATLDETKRHVAECLSAEERTGTALSVAEAEVERQREAAESLSGDDAVVEAFAAWLRSHRLVLDEARGEHQRAVAETALARAALAAARGALEAAEELRALRLREAEAEELRADQRAMDELAQPRRNAWGD